MSFFSLPDGERFTEKYLSGLPGFTFPQTVQIGVSDSLNIKLLSGFKATNIKIPAEDILELGYNEEVYRSAGKAAAGAIIGGVLTGGIGLLAGAALGGKRRKENTLHLVVRYEDKPCTIEFKPSKTIPRLHSALKRIMPEASVVESSSAADELLKFSQLRDQGIITEEEFQSKKRELL